MQSCRGSSPDLYWYQAFFLHTFPYAKGLRWLHYLLAKRPVNILCPFSFMNVNQPENTFSLEVFFFFYLHHPQSTNKVKLHCYRTKVQLVTTKYLTQRSNVADVRATTCFFSIPTILTNKIYEKSNKYWLNNETLNQFYLTIFNSSKGSTFLECFRFLCLSRLGGCKQSHVELKKSR